MDYNNFKEALLTALKNYYSDEANIFTREVLKTNNIRLDGLTVAYDAEDRLQPVIYLNPYFEKYTNGDMSFEEIIKSIIALRERSGVCDELREAVSNLTDWDKISEFVYPMLVNTESNKELLEEVVNKNFLDLSVIYYIRMPSLTDNAQASVKITKTMLKSYGIDEEEIHNTAIYNLCHKDSFLVRDIFEVLNSLMPGSVPEEATSPNMLVLSNLYGSYGAAQLLNIEKLDEQFTGQSFYVIPSSVHEAILVDFDNDTDPQDINAMIRDINGSVLDQSDILSDHVYLYDGTCKQLAICA